MPKRISADIDLSILADLGLGMLYKDAATKYNVSPSYISKLASGKKVPDIYITSPNEATLEKNVLDVESISEVIRYIGEHVALKDSSVEVFINRQITDAIMRIKLFSIILKKHKGGK